MDIEPFPRPEWSPLPQADCRGVEGRVLLRTDRLVVAMLRFEPGGTIHEHPAQHPIDVCCLEGAGLTSVGDESRSLAAGQRVAWPANISHRLWTTDAPMLTLMIEHTALKADS
jgi:quercetin dioxygenase-like cupin family protein